MKTEIKKVTSNRARNVRRTVALSLLLASAALSACNTTKGAGKDMENLGENIQGSAERSKP
jgi:predicted small secreted protein